MARRTKKFSEFVSGDLEQYVGLANGTNTRTTSGGGSGGGGTLVVTQVGHGLDRGDWVRFDGVDYVVANSSTAITGEAIGVVSRYIDADNFELQQSGHIADLSAQNGPDAAYLPLTSGQAYFLSETVDGELQIADPSTLNSVSKPCLIATSTTGGWIMSLERGKINGSGGATSGGPTGDGNIYSFNQVGHGFIVGDWIRVSGVNTFTKAQADTFANSLTIGMVVEVVDADNFKVQTAGYTEVLSGLGAAPIHHYLSDTTAGAMQTSEPTGAASQSRPVFINLNTTSGFILEQRTLPISFGPNFVAVTQAPGFAVGKVMRVDTSGTYAEAQADSLANSDRTVGVVVYSSGNDFIIQTEGYTDKITVGTAATLYYLHATSAGDMTTVEPTTTGQVSLPIYKSLTLNSGYIVENRPLVQPYGGGGGGLTLLSTQTAAASASLDFDNVFSATYDSYLIVFENLVFSAQNMFLGQYGTGGGPTYQTSNYLSTNESDNTTSMALDVKQSGVKSVAGLVLSPDRGGTTQLSVLSGRMMVYGVNDTGVSDYKRATWELSAYYPSGGEHTFSCSGGLWTQTTALTSIRFVPGSGTITTGRIKVYGLGT